VGHKGALCLGRHSCTKEAISIGATIKRAMREDAEIIVVNGRRIKDSRGKGVK
jgi:hypothetical protein